MAETADGVVRTNDAKCGNCAGSHCLQTQSWGNVHMRLELETKICKVFTIMEKAPTHYPKQVSLPMGSFKDLLSMLTKLPVPFNFCTGHGVPISHVLALGWCLLRVVLLYVNS